MNKRGISSQISLFKFFALIGKPLYYTLLFISLLTFLSFAFLQTVGSFLPRFVQFTRTTLTKPTKRLISKLRTSPTVPTSLPRIPPSHWPKQFSLTLIVVFVISLTISWVSSLPSPHLLKEKRPNLTTKIYDRSGVLLYKIFSNENRTLVNLEELPKHLLHATIAAEDKNFYKHLGVSPTGIVRAIKNNATGNTLQGGSTITQQLVKNTLLSAEKTFARKFKEIILSLSTELIYNKDEILEMYLNQIPYGGTAYGVEEAAAQYFGKSARSLTLAESALLASLPAAPTTLSPFGSNPYLAKIRQEDTLQKMHDLGYITLEELESALSETLTFNSQGIEIKAPHFVMYVRELLVNEFGEEMISRGGLEIKTTLDYEKQQILQNVIDEEIIKLKNLKVTNAAGLITNPQTGEILAMVGSRDYFDFGVDGQVNITTSLRQPGSAIKPITYALAFSRGLTPATKIDDSPICFKIKNQPPYCPKNYDGKFHGTVSLRTALASSYNVPAVKLLNSLGIENMINLAREMGIKTWEDPSRFGLSLTLGGGEITMLDLAEVYGTFAGSGTHTSLYAVQRVNDVRGQVIQEHTPSKKQVISPKVAYQISHILSDNAARAPAFGPNSVLNTKFGEIAVKTGTTNNLRDNWTIGFTENILVAIWVGNNDNTPMSRVASGITGASPIWAKTISRLSISQEPPKFSLPEGLLKLAICPTTGTIYCPACPTPAKTEYFVRGTEPKTTCTPQQIGDILPNAASTTRSNPN